MNNFHKKFILELNQEILNVIYQHTPYAKIDKRFKISIFMIFIISVFIGILTFDSANGSRAIDSPLGLSLTVSIIGVFIPFSMMCVMHFSNEQEEIGNQIFDFQQLNKAVGEIQKQGLYSQFMQDSLFEPITNPSSPITYADFWKIGKEQDKRMGKLIQSEIAIKNKNITDQQKLCVGKYRDKSN